jgi:hypothetical protein
MDGKVKYMGSAPGKAPAASKKAVIDGQGSIPYCELKDIATPNTAKGISTTGTKRGMGAALRGGQFTAE